MNQKILLVLLVVGILAIVPYLTSEASAHVEKSFGDVTVKVGLANEPPLEGDANQIQITLAKGNVTSAQPIADTGLDSATETIKYGGITKTLSFTPSDDTPGEYVATIIPSQLGSYYIILTGSIDGQPIDNGTFPLDQVESRDDYYFPPGSGQTSQTQQGTPSSNLPGSQFSTVVNQLAGDINDAKNMANSTNQAMLSMQQSYQGLKNTADELFIISGIGIGTGIAGIVIAVYSLNRRNGSHQV